MSTYSIYGLTIHSELPLPELIPTTAPPEVYIRIRHLIADSLPVRYGPQCNIAETEFGTLLISNGREIVFDPLPECDESVLRSIVLGPAMAHLLRQRGLFALHASCVAVEGRAVAFAGDTGWGKSTLALALHARGFDLVNDDVMAIQFSAVQPLVLPTHPQVKLMPQAAIALGYDADKLPRLHPQTVKRTHRVPRGLATTSLPLQRVYILAEGDEPGIETMRPQEALLMLVHHSWGMRSLTGPDDIRAHFQQCILLVKQVPICLLRRTRSLSTLVEFVAIVEEDIKHHLSPITRDRTASQVTIS